MNAGWRMTIGGGLLLVAILAGGGCRKAPPLRIGGGPTGGTYQQVAEGLAAVLALAEPGLRVSVERSGGSLANLRAVERGELDMAIVYAGDAYLGSLGQLEKKLPPTANVLALGRLYGATAHLVVRHNSGIWSPQDLRKRRVAIGNPGSGAALSAERYFRSLGIWQEIIPVYLGYSMAARELAGARVEAVWEMVGYPSESLAELSDQIALRLLDLQSPALAAGVFESYPFYRPMIIPAGTYRGQQADVPTFQDAALWVAGSQVDEELVEKALISLFSEAGLAQMGRVHQVARDIAPSLGLYGVEIPLHPGAEKFWQGSGSHFLNGRPALKKAPGH